MKYSNSLKNEIQNDNFLMENTKMFSIKGETGSKAGGRKPIPIVYRNETIDGCECTIGNVTTKGVQIDFIIDKEDEEKVKQRNWFSASDGKYIACNVNIEDQRRLLYMHNFIMDKFTFDGKGQKETVDHINRNGLDNRKSNLRIISQTLQNINQKKKARSAILPEGISDLPKHIWYIKPSGNHGDRFAVEIKSEKIIRKTTSSKTVFIQDKLQQALKIRDELYDQFPYLKN